jgi:hypothetical protein
VSKQPAATHGARGQVVGQVLYDHESNDTMQWTDGHGPAARRGAAPATGHRPQRTTTAVALPDTDGRFMDQLLRRWLEIFIFFPQEDLLAESDESVVRPPPRQAQNSGVTARIDLICRLRRERAGVGASATARESRWRGSLAHAETLASGRQREVDDDPPSLFFFSDQTLPWQA